MPRPDTYVPAPLERRELWSRLILCACVRARVRACVRARACVRVIRMNLQRCVCIVYCKASDNNLIHTSFSALLTLFLPRPPPPPPSPHKNHVRPPNQSNRTRQENRHIRCTGAIPCLLSHTRSPLSLLLVGPTSLGIASRV